jgi:tetratricopeptide (TPR) repeat protein
LKEDLAAMDCERPNSRLGESAKKTLEETKGAISDARSQIKVLESNISSFKKILSMLETNGCPISDKLICTTDKTVVTSEIEESIASTDKMVVALNEKLNLALKKEAEAYSTLKEHEAAFALYQKKLLKLQQIEMLEKADVKEPVNVDVSDLELLQKKSAMLSEELERARKLEESQKAQDECERLSVTIAMYNEIIEALSPKNGVRQKMLESSAKPLTSHLNDSLGNILPGKCVMVDASDGFKVKVGDIGSVYKYDFSAASSSEQARIALAMFNMLNSLSGFRVLMLDNLDVFDAKSLEHVFDFVQSNEVLDNYDSIFLAGIDNDQLKDVTSRLKPANAKVIQL